MADDEDWRRRRAEELGLVDTGPWLGGARRERVRPLSEAPPERPVEEAPQVVPEDAAPAVRAYTPAIETPAPARLAPPVAVAPKRLAAPRQAEAPAGGIPSWFILFAVVALAAAGAFGWLLRGAATPTPLDRAMTAAPVVPVPRAAGPDAVVPPVPDAPVDMAPPAVVPPVSAPVIRAPVAAGAAPATVTPAAGAPSRAPVRPPRWTPPRSVAAAGRDFAPSFNCRRATADVNRLICSDADLSSLDREMSSRYRMLVAEVDLPTERRLDEDQADFLNARAQCGDAGCIERLYRQRIEELR